MHTALGPLPDYEVLSSFEQVIGELGGIAEVSRLTGRSRGAVFNWRMAGLIPSAHYLRIQNALAERGLQAGDHLFTFQPPDPPLMLVSEAAA